MPRETDPTASDRDPLWYKDAIIYQLHVKCFCDHNDDGIGDFGGLTSKLDYIRDLGATAIWLLPFYPSPLKDDGYDIADYLDVHPDYGTLRELRAFVRRAHQLGLKVITELVINHTSEQHPWFQAARRAPPGSAKRDFYVWSDTDQKLAGLDSLNPSVKPNTDGSYTMWFGPRAPEGKEGNWIQTMPGKSYHVLLRLYGPLQPWFDKTWKPGDFEPVK